MVGHHLKVRFGPHVAFLVLLSPFGLGSTAPVRAATHAKKHTKPSYSDGPLPLLAPPPTPETPQPSAQPSAGAVTHIQSDPQDVWATARAMSEAVRQTYGKLGRAEAFHRLAIPQLLDVGEASASRHMGLVLTEMLANDLAQTTPFVVLEREHLRQAMVQNRLTDLYRIDTPSAVAFGRLLGANTLLTGAVEETDGAYTVHLRQLDLSSGRVLLESEATLARDALDAAAAESVVERTMKNALWRSAIFPGWGQAYLQEPKKAILIAGGGAATLATATGLYIAAAVARSQYMHNTASTVGDRQTANNCLLAGNVALVAYAAIWLVNMADVYLSPMPATQVQLFDPASTALDLQ